MGLRAGNSHFKCQLCGACDDLHALAYLVE